jgi:succinoglycan biosynthesis protein ExoA
VGTGYEGIKPVLDAVLAAILLVLTSPLFLASCLLVKLTSPGPVIYSQRRVGRGGRVYTMYKIRSMVHNCELRSGPRWSTPSDPRVTAVGRFLRRTHLDELPQLWNVLRNEMSLVGPRPERPEFVAHLALVFPDYRQRLNVAPGITGFAQIQLPPDSDLESVALKLRYDLYYAERVSLASDLRILLGTVPHILGFSPEFTRALCCLPTRDEVESESQSRVAAASVETSFEVDPTAASAVVPTAAWGTAAAADTAPCRRSEAVSPRNGASPGPDPIGRAADVATESAGWSSGSVSVIVPVRNEERNIAQTLGDLLALDKEGIDYEILVVDGDSTDATRDVVRSLMADHPELKLLRNPRRLSSAARNVGIAYARGEFVVIVDGHCRVTNRAYLHDLVDGFVRSGADSLGRPQPLDVPGATVFQRAIAAARSSWLGHHPASHIYSSGERLVRPQSVAVAYRRSVFTTVGLFDESFDACEDVEFNHRLDRKGLTCFFTPKIGVSYHPRSSLRGLFQQMVRYGRGRARLLRKHPETLSLSCLVPMAFVAGLVLGPIAAWYSSWCAAALAATLLIYFGLIAVAAVGAARRAADLGVIPWFFLVFPTIHVGAGCGLLGEWIHGHILRRAPGVPVGQLSGTLPQGNLEGAHLA